MGVGFRGLVKAMTCVGFVACAGESSSVAYQAPEVVDSAGVTITVSSAPEWGGRQAYRIGRRPSLTIGEVEGTPETSFGRVMDAVRLSSGSVVVLDGQVAEVHLFGPDGQFLRTLGKEGDGPGEFRLPRALFVRDGDTLAVFDRGNRRVTSFGPDGELLSATRMDIPFAPRVPDEMPAQSCCVPVGVGAEGVAIWRHPEVWSATGPGLRPTYATFVSFDPEGMGPDTIGTFAGGIAAPWDGPNPAIPITFSPRIQAQVLGSHLYEGNGDHLGYRVHSLDGQLLRVVRAAKPRVPVTNELLQRWKETEAERYNVSPEATPERVRQILEHEHADSLPAFGFMYVDRMGHVWLTAPTDPGSREVLPTTAEVFSPSGVWLGSVELPERTYVRDIGENYILGVQAGEWGEPRVVVYDLDRGER